MPVNNLFVGLCHYFVVDLSTPSFQLQEARIRGLLHLKVSNPRAIAIRVVDNILQSAKVLQMIVCP